MKRFLLVDGNYLMFQSFYATYRPDSSYIMSNQEGVTTNGTFQFFNMLTNLIQEVRPDYLFIAFDAPGKTFRHEKLDSYKDNRVSAPVIIFDQFKWTKHILNDLNIAHAEIVGAEADDLIATLSTLEDTQKIIYSADKDLLQLVNEDICIIKRNAREGIFEYINLANFESHYEIRPEQIIDYKGLFGDTSDNLPGVKGIGDKTAKKLLLQYGNWDTIYQNLDNLTPSVRKKLIEGKESGELCRELATLKKDVAQLNHNLVSYELNISDNYETLEYLELNRIINKFEKI
ncbi:5'-3' exonuclease [Mycoplasmopsis pullorum]|uniref:5'-3' exonuclease n=1 Tax=Mycoplasmopsis pullorum TaxID=48003 RepID=A0A1L4FRF1_9BACT|nr:5'-3' exonuclease [Mycoplasmopsis pullorum]APJ38195.1 hypothetical protein BLA55_00630 [Mycoplasmopsis pullorum]